VAMPVNAKLLNDIL